MSEALRLQPGRQINFRVPERKIAGEAAVLEAGEGTITVSLQGELTLQGGEALVLEICEREDALYLIDARVVEGRGSGAYLLEQQGSALRRQRRRFQRIPATLRAEYALLGERGPERSFQQGVVLDISSGGALLCAEQALEIGSECWLVVEMPQALERPYVTGFLAKVLRRQQSRAEGKNCYGLEFNRPLSFLQNARGRFSWHHP